MKAPLPPDIYERLIEWHEGRLRPKRRWWTLKSHLQIRARLEQSRRCPEKQNTTTQGQTMIQDNRATNDPSRYAEKRRARYEPTPRPYVQEDVHNEATITIERKLYTVTRRSNARGQFLRIVEEAANVAGGWRNVLIVALDGIDSFLAAIATARAERPATGLDIPKNQRFPRDTPPPAP